MAMRVFADIMLSAHLLAHDTPPADHLMLAREEYIFRDCGVAQHTLDIMPAIHEGALHLVSHCQSDVVMGFPPHGHIFDGIILIILAVIIELFSFRYVVRAEDRLMSSTVRDVYLALFLHHREPLALYLHHRPFRLRRRNSLLLKEAVILSIGHVATLWNMSTREGIVLRMYCYRRQRGADWLLPLRLLSNSVVIEESPGGFIKMFFPVGGEAAGVHEASLAVSVSPLYLLHTPLALFM